jgi:hypothetical protein
MSDVSPYGTRDPVGQMVRFVEESRARESWGTEMKLLHTANQVGMAMDVILEILRYGPPLTRRNLERALRLARLSEEKARDLRAGLETYAALPRRLRAAQPRRSRR